ncbi:proline-rich transmembrane protein 2-like isoform X2 [Dreissena polymorpha]|uniref:Proline-rich transmembrane protein 1-like n=1 Tax=Dreissena polymorpha TaxID=45954 RepID=A0A9D4K2R9_DREPO|nr:proline-rich transmembrane protein 2-like isoform X2 [Dreissena polymorpha]KAH3831202.1 hypothetical protein DPMN_104464 [Dreissena polymorpha]
MMEKAGVDNIPSEKSRYWEQSPPQQLQQPQPPAYTQQHVYYGQPQGYQQQAGHVQQGYGGAQGHVVVLAQPQPSSVPVGQRPTDFMVPSIIACLCCFWPTGAAAIYFAMQSKNALNSGDITNAKRYSVTARNLMISSIVIGVIWIAAVIAVYAYNLSRVTTRHCTYGNC